MSTVSHCIVFPPISFSCFSILVPNTRICTRYAISNVGISSLHVRCNLEMNPSVKSCILLSYTYYSVALSGTHILSETGMATGWEKGKNAQKRGRFLMKHSHLDYWRRLINFTGWCLFNASYFSPLLHSAV